MAANEMKSLTEKYKEATEKLKTYEDARLRCSCGAIINAEKVTLTRVSKYILSANLKIYFLNILIMYKFL